MRADPAPGRADRPRAQDNRHRRGKAVLPVGSQASAAAAGQAMEPTNRDGRGSLSRWRHWSPAAQDAHRIDPVALWRTLVGSQSF